MGKHSASKEKSNFGKIIKFILFLIIIAAIILGILYVSNLKKDKIQVAQNVNSLFESLKELNKEQIEKYVNYKMIVSGLDEMIINEDNENSELQKELFKDISWSIESVNINGKEAVAIVEMTNKNFKNILTKWMKEIVKEKTEDNEISEKVALEKLKEVLKDETVRKTIIKKIKLEKNEDEWKIEVNDDLIDLIFPGIESVAEVLN